MAGPVDAKVVGLAAGLQIAVVVPPALLVAALRRDDLGAESNMWLVAFFLTLVVGPAAAGVLAGRRRPEAPLLHGAAGAGLAWALLAGISLLRGVAGSDEVAPLLVTLLTIAPIQVGVGVLGAFFARPPAPTEEDGPMTDASPTPTAERS